MSSRALVVIGDALLDRDVEGTVERLSPDAPVPVLDEERTVSRPGGGALAAALAASDGRPVRLITALAGDGAAVELRGLLGEHGVEVIDLGLDGPTPEKVRVRTGGRSLLRLDRGGDATGRIGGRAGAAARAALRRCTAVLVSDYGRGMAAIPGLRHTLEEIAARVPVVWDPHPRGPGPTAGAAVATPNESEVTRLAPEPRGGNLVNAAARAEAALAGWAARALCVTRGSEGALLVRPGAAPLAIPAPAVRGGDPCGAGDRFASRLASELADGALLDDAALEAVTCASAFVAAGGAGTALGQQPESDGAPGADGGLAHVECVRAATGTVVATGGCFDLLHAGHVRTLETARRLGDCLVVCMNSDASVRRLKGPDRPLVPQEDRAAVLEALGCVDAVVSFDEDTPERVLETLRPDVWVKGGDYSEAELPEAAVMERWGGRCVVLPYIEGRSTTRLIQEAAERVGT